MKDLDKIPRPTCKNKNNRHAKTKIYGKKKISVKKKKKTKKLSG